MMVFLSLLLTGASALGKHTVVNTGEATMKSR